MTAQLEGRALDARVAEALGWTDVREGTADERELLDCDLVVGRPPHGVGELCSVRSYSHDFSALPELIDWLGNRCANDDAIVIHIGDVGTVASMSNKFGDLRSTAEGATLPEAIARLVVAVSQRAKEQP